METPASSKPGPRHRPTRRPPLAQLDRASGYEPGGRRFESCRARQPLLDRRGPLHPARLGHSRGPNTPLRSLALLHRPVPRSSSRCFGGMASGNLAEVRRGLQSERRRAGRATPFNKLQPTPPTRYTRHVVGTVVAGCPPGLFSRFVPAREGAQRGPDQVHRIVPLPLYSTTRGSPAGRPRRLGVSSRVGPSGPRCRRRCGAPRSRFHQGRPGDSSSRRCR
jgi:hypothetical protein